MKSHILLPLLLLLMFGACSAPIPAPVKVKITNEKIDYLKDVKPILDKRCVTCHSCYNSPCQAKMSSFEGVDR
ncbi:MAG: peptidylprolyl isomerase, partial [Campylobacterota bacterium]|nr:peptidylprolyl isomerase [Campylobacterota bacterium]